MQDARSHVPPEQPDSARGGAVPFAVAFRFWVKLGFISFGGPTGQIAIMHTELVERRRWIGEERFLHALNYCMFLPGPEATQLAIYIGWLLHGTLGGIVAGVFFVLPSVVILGALSWIYAAQGAVPWVSAIFAGLAPAVMALVAHAVIRIGKKALKNEVMAAVALAAFVAVYFFGVPFPAIVASAALIGWIGGRVLPRKFIVIRGHGAQAREGDLVAHADARVPPSWGRALRVTLTCLVLWWAPVAALALWRGPESVFVQEGVFFSKAAMVTFGGAYAVLPYVAQASVERFGWVSAHEMVAGLGLAESTPGPLIMVVQFVGFLGGWHHAGDLPPLLAAAIGGLITTWVTFVPCFLWIFLGAPYIERLRGNERLSAALSAITAAVVGVVLNLAVWFARHTLFPGGEDLAGLDVFALAVALIAFVGMWRWRWDVVPVVIGSSLIGLARHVLA